MCRNQVVLIFANNSKPSQNFKSPEHAFVDIVKLETCGKFQKKILNCMAVGARQNVFRQKKPWFLENNRALSKFSNEILH